MSPTRVSLSDPGRECGRPGLLRGNAVWADDGWTSERVGPKWVDRISHTLGPDLESPVPWTPQPALVRS